MYMYQLLAKNVNVLIKKYQKRVEVVKVRPERDRKTASSKDCEKKGFGHLETPAHGHAHRWVQQIRSGCSLSKQRLSSEGSCYSLFCCFISVIFEGTTYPTWETSSSTNLGLFLRYFNPLEKTSEHRNVFPLKTFSWAGDVALWKSTYLACMRSWALFPVLGKIIFSL